MAGIEDRAEMYLKQAESRDTCLLKEEFDQMSIEDQKAAITKMRELSLRDPKSTLNIEPFTMQPMSMQYQTQGVPIWSAMITNKSDQVPVFQVWWMPGFNYHGTSVMKDCSK